MVSEGADTAYEVGPGSTLKGLADEAANAAKQLRSPRRGNQWFDPFDQPIPGVNIDSCVAVGQSILVALVHIR